MKMTLQSARAPASATGTGKKAGNKCFIGANVFFDFSLLNQ
jgi:hypothetical protein